MYTTTTWTTHANVVHIRRASRHQAHPTTVYRCASPSLGCVQPRIPASTHHHRSLSTARPTAAPLTWFVTKPQRRHVQALQPAQAAVTSSKSLPPPPVMDDGEAVVASAERVRRLGTLVQLRRAYQNVLYAEVLLSQTSPIYQPLTAEQKADLSEEEMQNEQDALLMVAVEIIGEMLLTVDDMEAGLKALPPGFGAVFPTGQASDNETAVQERVGEVVQQLQQRAQEEITLLPFPSVAAARAAVDARNLQATGRVTDPSTSMDAPDTIPGANGNKIRTLEKAAEKFVAQRLQPAVAKVRSSTPKDWVGNAKAAATYAGELWDRLNGGRAGEVAVRPPEGLPLPVSSKETRASTLERLALTISDLEKQLQDASKAREAKLRKADISMRARLAPELRKLDDEVSSLSRALAVRTLQLEMEAIYGALEDEAVENCAGKSVSGVKFAGRVGSDAAGDELQLLAAEFALLDEALSALVALVDRGSAVVISEEELLSLATDVPDLRNRLGIADGQVFASSGMSLFKLQLQLKEAVRKLQEGVEFGTRGVRLMGSDVAGAARMFWRAALGDTLKPREVQALRRTVRDLLTFIPFAIILIAPLTPVGHVLVFGFIQRYFPGFFPSQFSARRQEIMMRYEQLQQELQSAQERAVEEAEEAELAQAAAAVARLTAPRLATAGGGVFETKGVGEGDDAAARVRQLQEAVLQAEDTLMTDEEEESGGGAGGHAGKEEGGARGKKGKGREKDKDA